MASFNRKGIAGIVRDLDLLSKVGSETSQNQNPIKKFGIVAICQRENRFFPIIGITLSTIFLGLWTTFMVFDP